MEVFISSRETDRPRASAALNTTEAKEEDSSEAGPGGREGLDLGCVHATGIPKIIIPIELVIGLRDVITTRPLRRPHCLRHQHHRHHQVELRKGGALSGR